MDQKRILKFLRQIMTNNNREWFQEHKKEYERLATCQISASKGLLLLARRFKLLLRGRRLA